MEENKGYFKFRKVSEKKVLELINSAENSTSSVFDRIDTRSLKIVASKLAPAITRTFNLSIKLSVFPSE